jgi:hypothetical protein
LLGLYETTKECSSSRRSSDGSASRGIPRARCTLPTRSEACTAEPCGGAALRGGRSALAVPRSPSCGGGGGSATFGAPEAPHSTSARRATSSSKTTHTNVLINERLGARLARVTVTRRTIAVRVCGSSAPAPLKCPLRGSRSVIQRGPTQSRSAFWGPSPKTDPRRAPWRYKKDSSFSVRTPSLTMCWPGARPT